MQSIGSYSVSPAGQRIERPLRANANVTVVNGGAHNWSAILPKGWKTGPLCLCHPQTHNSHHSNHSAGLMKEAGGRGKGFCHWRRWQLVKRGPFGPVFPVNVLYSGGLIMFLRFEASSTRGCSLIMALVWMHWLPSCNWASIYHRKKQKMLFILPSVRFFFLYEILWNITAVSALNHTFTGYWYLTRDTPCPSVSC